jgi:hypothetical protein
VENNYRDRVAEIIRQLQAGESTRRLKEVHSIAAAIGCRCLSLATGRKPEVLEEPIRISVISGTQSGIRNRRVPSEATPDKRDIAFDLVTHNPKVDRSNRSPQPAIFISSPGPA